MWPQRNQPSADHVQPAGPTTPASCSLANDEPLGLKVQAVIRTEQVSGADFLTWVQTRGVGLAPADLSQQLPGLRPGESLTICVLSVADLAPPGPPLPDVPQPLPADTAVVVLRSDGSMTLDGMGSQADVLAELTSLTASD